MQTITLSKEQVQVFAAAIRPQIKAYINENREQFEVWLRADREKATAGEVNGKSMLKTKGEINHEQNE